jgi:O-antigen/teichoic acid export membrane protein
MALVPLIALPVAGGVPQLLTREIARYIHSREWGRYKGLLRALHVWVALGSVLIILGFFLLKFTIIGFVDSRKVDLLSIAIFLVPLMGFAAVRAGAIKGMNRPSFAELPNLVIQPIIALFSILIVIRFFELDVNAAIHIQLFAATLSFIIASLIFLSVQPKIDHTIRPQYEIAKWAPALLPFTVLALIGVFNAQIGVILVGLLSSNEEVAAMRIAERIGQFVMLSLTLVNLIIAPYIVLAHKEENILLLQRLAKKSAQGSFLLALPIGLLFIIFGDVLVGLAFGEEYVELSYLPIVIITVGQLVNVFFGSVSYFLTMSGHEKDTLKAQVLAVITNIIVCIILTPSFGAIGAAVGFTISMIIWNVILYRMVQKRLGIRTIALG